MKRQGAGTTHDDFMGWMQEVDRITQAKADMSIHDLPDMQFRSAFDAGDSPQDFFDEYVVEELVELGWEQQNEYR